MQTLEITNKALDQQIEKIYELLNILQKHQDEQKVLLQKNHTIYMKKLDKLQEYNKIADMTNQVFEKRLLVIENALRQMNKTISA